jgi:putative heme iron utilization protein
MTADMDEETDLIHQAHGLWRSRFHGVLSTLTHDGSGQPFGSLVTFSLDRHDQPLLLLSHLARHTRNLEVNPVCCLTLVEAGDGDAQQLMRLNADGRILAATGCSEQECERHYRYFPQARIYHQQLNFRFYRMEVEHFYFVGGFGAARGIGRSRMLQPSPLSHDQELRLIHDLESAHRRQLERAATRHCNYRPDNEVKLTISGIDPAGIDLLWDERILRLNFKSETATAAEIESAIMELLSA